MGKTYDSIAAGLAQAVAFARGRKVAAKVHAFSPPDVVQSLATLSEAEVAERWLAEAERRDAEMESEQVKGIPGVEVFRRLYARYFR